MRTESDFLGKIDIEDDALYGINALRAKENFPDSTPFFIEWYKAVAQVKLACYLTCKNYQSAVISRFGKNNLPISIIGDDILTCLIQSAEEMASGKYFGQFIVPAVQGGAGTSINMNINEIIANVTLLKLGKRPGDYSVVDPIEHANIFQSTNDVIPTSLKVAAMLLLNKLETGINTLRQKVEALETRHRNDLRIAYTQMQEAVPTSFGKLFSTYSEALSRDWWRVSKCFERIKVVNLGGSAVGTGIAVPRFFIMEENDTLPENEINTGENAEDNIDANELPANDNNPAFENKAIIRLENVSVYQKSILILSEVSFSIEKGEFVYLIGKTGTGKSSLLKTLYAELPVTQGDAHVAEYDLKNIKIKEIPFLRRKLGIVFQDFQLLTDRSVNENLEFVMRATGWKDVDLMKDRINNVLDKVGLETKGFKMPHQLSGGEQQRLCIARALVNDPEIILADEPTGNLDPETSEGIMQLLFTISQSGRAVFMATHNYTLFENFPSRTLKCEYGKVFEN